MGPQCAEAINTAAAKKRGAKPAPVLGALSTQLHSRALTASETAYMQVRTCLCMSSPKNVPSLGSQHDPLLWLTDSPCKLHRQSSVLSHLLSNFYCHAAWSTCQKCFYLVLC